MNGRGKSGSVFRKTNSARKTEQSTVTPINAVMAKSDSKVPLAAKTIASKTVKISAIAGVPPLLTVAALIENNPSRLIAKRVRGVCIIMALTMLRSETRLKTVMIVPPVSPKTLDAASAAGSFESAMVETGKT